MLLDEPLSGQDLESQEKFVEAVQEFRDQGVSIAIACHENHLIEKLADRAIVITNKTIHSSREFTAKLFNLNVKMILYY